MGRMGDLFIDLMNERGSNIPEGAAYDPDAPWNQMFLGMKECPECHGDGYPEERVQCDTCKGTGCVPKIDQDEANDRENEIIGNAEMMNDI